jgi:hypothetical protein
MANSILNLFTGIVGKSSTLLIKCFGVIEYFSKIFIFNKIPISEYYQISCCTTEYYKRFEHELEFNVC